MTPTTPPSVTDPVVETVARGWIRAAHLKKTGASEVVTEEQAARLVREQKSFVWVHVHVENKEEAAVLLRETMGFHELAVEDALSDCERPSMQEFEGFIFLGIPAVVMNERGESYREVGFFLTEKALVTVAAQQIPVIEEWFERWMKRPAHAGPDPATLAHSIIDALVDAYFPVIDALEDQLDELSESIFRGERNQIRLILRVKRRLLDLRRHIAPTRDVLNSLLRRDVTLVPDQLRPYFQDVFDHALRLSELADMNRETLASLLEAHLSMVSNSLNEVMKKMTVIATILMTMGLIAGIYGMNFAHMPELKWVYGYPFALFLMLAASGFILWMFRRNKWI